MLSALSLPFIGFPHKVYNIGIEMQITRPLVLEPSARIPKLYAPTDSEHKFNKTEIEN